jgi:hypothetical protein
LNILINFGLSFCFSVVILLSWMIIRATISCRSKTNQCCFVFCRYTIELGTTVFYLVVWLAFTLLFLVIALEANGIEGLQSNYFFIEVTSKETGKKLSFWERISLILSRLGGLIWEAWWYDVPTEYRTSPNRRMNVVHSFYERWNRKTSCADRRPPKTKSSPPQEPKPSIWRRF